MSDYQRFFESSETVPGDPADVPRALERLRRPGGEGTAVNRYPGPALYTVEDAWDPWLPDVLLAPYGLRALVGPQRRQRDANLGWGMWQQTARLPYEPVMFGAKGYLRGVAPLLGLWVPVYEGDPERLTWRRRKWWGRGPIIFSPWGRFQTYSGHWHNDASASRRPCR